MSTKLVKLESVCNILERVWILFCSSDNWQLNSCILTEECVSQCYTVTDIFAQVFSSSFWFLALPPSHLPFSPPLELFSDNPRIWKEIYSASICQSLNSHLYSDNLAFQRWTSIFVCFFPGLLGGVLIYIYNLAVNEIFGKNFFFLGFRSIFYICVKL